MAGSGIVWGWRRMETLLASRYWSASWAWGLPMILAAVLFHVSGLWLFTVLASHVERRWANLNRSYPMFVLVLAVTVLLVTIMHGLEAAAWAVAYVALGALPDFPSAILFSLNAMTTYGHDNISLEYHWKLLGALEALNGMLLFGLTTAFLFAVAQRVWPVTHGHDRPVPRHRDD